VVTEERTNEVRSLLATLRRWALGKPEIVAVGLVGSWVRDARMDSDVDVGLLTEEQTPYPEDDAWVREVGGVEFVWTRQWGTVTERRFALPSGLEVELSVAPPSWAVTDPERIAVINNEGAPPGPSHLFRADIAELVVVHLGDPPDHIVIESWHAGRGVERRKRLRCRWKGAPRW
jgi:uncharacterized protein